MHWPRGGLCGTAIAFFTSLSEPHPILLLGALGGSHWSHFFEYSGMFFDKIDSKRSSYLKIATDDAWSRWRSYREQHITFHEFIINA